MIGSGKGTPAPNYDLEKNAYKKLGCLKIDIFIVEASLFFNLRLHQFEVTTMLPVHTTAVKRRLIKLLSSTWLLVYGSKFQLNDVIAFTATEEDR